MNYKGAQFYKNRPFYKESMQKKKPDKIIFICCGDIAIWNFMCMAKRQHLKPVPLIFVRLLMMSLNIQILNFLSIEVSIHYFKKKYYSNC